MTPLVGDTVFFRRSSGMVSKGMVVKILPACPSLAEMRTQYCVHWKENRPQFECSNGECVFHVSVTLEKWIEEKDIVDSY